MVTRCTLLLTFCLLLFGAAPALAEPLAPDFYLPTQAELPPGVELKMAPGPTALGIWGQREDRTYASYAPLALVGATVSTVSAEMAPQMFGSAVSAYLGQGYVVSRTNAPGDLDLFQPGPELNHHVRFAVARTVLSKVTVVYNNTVTSEADATALSDSFAAPMVARMQAHPDAD